MKDYFPYAILGIVAVVAIVTLAFSSGIVGAPVYKQQIAQDQFPCIEDDVGNDYDIAGTATVGKIQYEDYCQGDQLTQYYCATSNTIGQTHKYLCPNGCSLGACL